jgi:hypothetical protein
MRRPASFAGALSGIVTGLFSLGLGLGLGLGLAGCGGSRASGPAWPQPTPSETDGGESLEPRQASSVAAIEKAGDESPATPAAATPAATPAAATPAAPGARPDRSTSEPAPSRDLDILTTEEIIIEIED